MDASISATDEEDTEAFMREVEAAIGLWLVTQTVYPQLPEAIRAVYTGEWRKPAPGPLACTPPKIIV